MEKMEKMILTPWLFSLENYKITPIKEQTEEIRKNLKPIGNSKRFRIFNNNNKDYVVINGFKVERGGEFQGYIVSKSFDKDPFLSLSNQKQNFFKGDSRYNEDDCEKKFAFNVNINSKLEVGKAFLDRRSNKLITDFKTKVVLTRGLMMIDNYIVNPNGQVLYLKKGNSTKTFPMKKDDFNNKKFISISL